MNPREMVGILTSVARVIATVSRLHISITRWTCHLGTEKQIHTLHHAAQLLAVQENDHSITRSHKYCRNGFLSIFTFLLFASANIAGAAQNPTPIPPYWTGWDVVSHYATADAACIGSIGPRNSSSCCTTSPIVAFTKRVGNTCYGTKISGGVTYYNSLYVYLTYHGPACDSGHTLSGSVCIPNDKPIPPKSNPGPPSSCDNDLSGGTNPINIASGNKYQIEKDYFTENDSNLSFYRQYNSTAGLSVGSINLSWRTNYDRAVALVTNETTSTAFVYRPDGRTYYFTLTNGVWTPDSDISDTLDQLKDGDGNAVGWRYKNSNDETEVYDVFGKLLSITGRLGATQTLTYDTDARLTKVSDNFGRFLSFTYDASNRIASMTDPSGRVYSFAYGVSNTLKSVTYPDGKPRTYLYENTSYRQALTGIIDENGKRYGTYKYDGAGRAISSEHAGTVEKYAVSYITDSSGIPVSSTVIDPYGAVRSTNLIMISGGAKNAGQSQPGGAGCSAASNIVAHDANGNVASRTDFNGNQTRYTYHQARNLETVRVEGLTGTGDPTSDTRTTSTTWHPDWRLKVGIAEPLRLTTLVYNGEPDPSNGDVPLSCAPAGVLVDDKPIAVLCKKIEQATTDADGSQGFAASPSGSPRIWSYTYNPFGRVLTADGPRTDVNDSTTYTYYPETDPDLGKRGNLASLTDAAGNVTLYTAYDANGRLTAYTDPNGLVTTLSYDLRGRLTGVNRGGETTAYTLDGVGQVTQVTLPDASTISYTYDAAHRLTDVTDTLGNKVHYTLDAAGNRIAEEITDPAGTLTGKLTRIYDVLGRLQQLTEIQQ